MLVSTTAMIGLLEITTRAWGLSAETVYINRKTIELDPNPQLQYRLRPNSVADAEVEYRINGHGLRGPETTLVKPSATNRIVVSGDSIAFGYWVAAEDAFVEQLADLANATRTTPDAIETVNLGVPGYNLRQNFERLQRGGLRFRPDLVILTVCLNDLETIFSYEYGLTALRVKSGSSRDTWTRLRAFALDHSMFATFLEYRFSLLRSRNVREPTDLSNSPTGRSPARDLATFAAKRAAQSAQLEQVFLAFAQLLRVNGNIPSLVVLFPGLDYAFPTYPHTAYHELVANAVRHAGLPFLDLLSCYSHYAVRDLAVDPVHPNPVGRDVDRENSSISCTRVFHTRTLLFSRIPEQRE